MLPGGIGNYGEALAVKYLSDKGCKILARNFRSKMGEIDVIAEDGKYIVFVEVKYRTDNLYGEPFEAVTAAKRRKIRRTAELYLLKTGNINRDCRFDVIDILDGRIEHYENAF